MVTAALSAKAQWNYMIEEVTGVNSKADEYLCNRHNDQLYFITNTEQSVQRTWSAASSYSLRSISKTSTFQSLSNPALIHDFRIKKDEWGVSPFDSTGTLIIASCNDYVSKGTALSKLYLLKPPLEKRNSAPDLLPFCNDKFNYKHPFYIAELKLLLFSSDRHGGQGGYDIWYTYFTNEGWTNPANCGGQVNTSGDEAFPTFFKGDIYFSSNGWLPERGFDLFRSEGKDQWMNAVQLEYPLNTEFDDYNILFLEEGRGLISSNRAGTKGGADIFLFNHVVQKVERHGLLAQLEANGINLPSATLTFLNASNEIQFEGQTNIQGKLDLAALSVGRNYKVKLSGINPALFTQCQLKLLDEHGNVLRIYRFNERGELELELLRFIYSDINFLKNEDTSMLSITLAGKVIHHNGAAWNAKISVIVLDDQGEILAVAKLNKEGAFEASSIVPDYHYQFRIVSPVETDRIVLFDNGKTIVLPILKQEAYYKRFDPSDGISLRDASGKEVLVSPDDVFVVNRLYFELNSASIENEGKKQLDALAELLDSNPHLSIHVTSYADSRGQSEYNLKLSQQRSQRFIQYLRSRGISSSRMQYDARGEEGILNECTDDILCDEMKHAINRRTEIKFVKPL